MNNNIFEQLTKNQNLINQKLVPVQKYCKSLPFDKLKNIKNVFYNVFKNNTRLEEKHKNLLCKNLTNRIEEIQRIISYPEIQRKTNKIIIKKIHNDYDSCDRQVDID